MAGLPAHPCRDARIGKRFVTSVPARRRWKGVQRGEPPPSNAPVRARGGEFERRRAIFERAVNYMPVACSLANVLAPLALPAQGRGLGQRPSVTRHRSASKR